MVFVVSGLRENFPDVTRETNTRPYAESLPFVLISEKNRDRAVATSERLWKSGNPSSSRPNKHSQSASVHIYRYEYSRC